MPWLHVSGVFIDNIFAAPCSHLGGGGPHLLKTLTPPVTTPNDDKTSTVNHERRGLYTRAAL
ncbi:hypothetical protein D9619_012833 [Psilocybe cf. subviscida]|uniref:Uncharacterized protein n=1 Tax=Psilocybe cf. subviscida TaxID=2480587 RepID=A0A8H5AR40_9AGAR|nr:hypothetical protein D9619_012833 [Psilocybe cf. subviscida]